MISRFPGFHAFLCLAVLGGPAWAAEAPVERLEIVDRAIEFHGGERYRRTMTELEICSRSGCYEIEARITGDEYAFDVSGEIQGQRRRVQATNDHVRVWGTDGEPREATRAEEQRLRDWAMERIYFPFLPYRLNDPSVFKTDLGLERWDGRELRRVKVTFAPGSSSDATDEYLYWFDPETGRVEQFAYSYEGTPGGLRFRRGFNYRRVGGILFFDQQNLGIEGDGLRVDQIDPDFVATMREVSTVELRELLVRNLD